METREESPQNQASSCAGFRGGMPYENSCGNPTRLVRHLCGITTGGVSMGKSKLDLLQGTLDMMVLQTLTSMGPLHGYGIARRNEQVSQNEVLLN